MDIDITINKLKQAHSQANYDQSLKIAEALLADESLLNHNQKFEALFYKGHALKALNRNDDAITVFKTLNNSYPKRHQGMQGLYQTYNGLKSWEKVLSIAIETQNRFPNFFLGYVWQANTYLQLDRLDLAESKYQHILQRFPEKHHGLEGLIKVSNRLQDLNRVIDLTEEFTTQYPNRWQGYWWQGQAYKSLGQYDKAKEKFNVLRNSFPNQHQGFQGEIQITQHQQDWQTVIELTEQFVEQYPTIWQGYWWRGQAFKNLGQYDEAKEQFDILKNSFPNQHQGFEGMVHIAQHQQDWQGTIEYAKQFVDTKPDLWVGYWYLGQMYKNLYQYDKAVEQFNILKNKFPNQHQGFQGEIQVAQHQQDWQTVIELTEQFVEQYSNMWQGYWWQGQAYKNLEQYDKAEEQFIILRNRFPNQHQGFEGLIHIAQDKQDYVQAIKLSEILVSDFPQHWFSYWHLAQAYKNNYRYDKALKALSVLKEKFPNQHQGLQGQIEVAKHQQDWKHVIELTEHFIDSYPTMWQGYFWQGQAYKNIGQYDKAEQVFTTLKSSFPNQHQGLQGLLHVAKDKQDWAQAVELSESLVSYFPYLWFSYWHLGQAYTQLRKFSEAKQIFKKLSIQYPLRISGLEGLVQIANIKGDFVEALEISHKIYQSFPNLYRSYDFVARAYRNLGEHEKSITWFEDLASKFPHRFEGLRGLVEVYSMHDDWTTPKELIHEGLDSFPNNIFFNIAIAKYYKEAGAVDNSIAIYRELIKLYPYNNDIYFNLALDAIEMDRKDIAISYIEEYSERLSDSEKSIYNFAQLDYLLGQFKKATSVYEDKIKNSKNLYLTQRAENLYRLGNCYQCLRMVEEAQNCYKEFKVLKDSFDGKSFLNLNSCYESESDLIHNEIRNQNFNKAKDMFNCRKYILNEFDRLRFESWFNLYAKFEEENIKQDTSSNVIQSLWIGKDLSIIQQLCLASYLYHGHEVHLYVYQDIKNIPKGVIIKDANEILNEDKIFYSHGGSPAVFADWFRWRLIFMKGGYWVDMDAICLRKFNFEESIVFGYESYIVSNAVLKFPSGHYIPYIMQYLGENQNYILPWDTDEEIRIKQYREQNEINIRGIFIEGNGPAGFTDMLQYFNILDQAKAFYTFFPFSATELRIYLLDEGFDSSLITKDMFAMHMWNHALVNKETVLEESMNKSSSLLQILIDKYQDYLPRTKII